MAHFQIAIITLNRKPLEKGLLSFVVARKEFIESMRDLFDGKLVGADRDYDTG